MDGASYLNSHYFTEQGETRFTRIKKEKRKTRLKKKKSFLTAFDRLTALREVCGHIPCQTLLTGGLG